MKRSDLKVARVDRDSVVGSAFPRYEINLPDGWSYDGCHSLITDKEGREEDIAAILKYARPCGEDCEACR